MRSKLLLLLEKVWMRVQMGLQAARVRVKESQAGRRLRCSVSVMFTSRALRKAYLRVLPVSCNGEATTAAGTQTSPRSVYSISDAVLSIQKKKSYPTRHCAKPTVRKKKKSGISTAETLTRIAVSPMNRDQRPHNGATMITTKLVFISLLLWHHQNLRKCPGNCKYAVNVRARIW